MRVIHCQRPKTQIEKTPSKISMEESVNSEIKQAKIPNVIDQDFMNQPIDLRKINPNDLPVSPGFHNEDELSVPLSTILGQRIHTASKEVQEDMEEMHKMLAQIEAEEKAKKVKPKSTLSHLYPTPVYRYCPEQAYTERTKQKIVNTYPFQPTANKSVARAFPYELFAPNIGVTLKPNKSTQAYKKNSLITPTFQ